MNVVLNAEPAPDYTRMNDRLNTAWSSADYSLIGIRLQITGEELAETADFRPGSRILDVAAGNGNATLAFARRWCDVVSTDYIDQVLDDGRRRAAAEKLDVEFQVADAQNLPFEDDEFDGVVSTFGVMFAPDQDAAASEILRVCKPGGKIALASWTKPGFIGRLCKLTGKHVNASSRFQAPANWGQEDWIRDHFEEAASDLTITRKDFITRYPSPQFYVDYFRQHYGLLTKAFEKVGEAGRQAFEDDILAVIDDLNTATDGTMSVPSEYAEVIITKR